jgi:hypothetical protein
MAVVKADGYGHGAATVAKAAVAAGAGWLGTTSVAEASALRAARLAVPAAGRTPSTTSPWPLPQRSQRRCVPAGSALTSPGSERVKP